MTEWMDALFAGVGSAYMCCECVDTPCHQMIGFSPERADVKDSYSRSYTALIRY